MLSLALQRETRVWLRRSLSALPNRHSRRGPPPTCMDGIELKELTEELLESKPGSLYTYQASPDEQTRAWEAADVTVQKTEFLVRGHAAYIPHSISYKQFCHKLVDKQEDSDPMERIETMQNLVNRLDQEGELYMELRKQVKSQLAVEENVLANEKEEVESSMEKEIESESAMEEEEEMELDVSDLEISDLEQADRDFPDFASPGPTIAMYDALLDSMSVATHEGTPKAVGTILERVWERYEDDGESENVNEYTVPTAMTFNGVLRAIANTKSDKERTRDDALYYAFGTYDAMREVIPRNSATYTYMLRTVENFLPPSRTRGNIAHGLWLQARNEKVVDPGVIQALHDANTPSNGPEHDKWLKEYMHDRGNDVLPKFKQNAKVRRHNKRYGAY